MNKDYYLICRKHIKQEDEKEVAGKNEQMHTRRLVLDELRRVGLTDIDPERARGFDVGTGELALLSISQQMINKKHQISLLCCADHKEVTK